MDRDAGEYIPVTITVKAVDRVEVVSPDRESAAQNRRLLNANHYVASMDGRELAKPTFDLEEEYLALIYFQFNMQLGMLFIPALCFMGPLVLMLEYVVDRVRLTRMCQKPPRIDGSIKILLVKLLLVNAIVCVLIYPTGAGWIMSGLPFEHCDDYFSTNVSHAFVHVTQSGVLADGKEPL